MQESKYFYNGIPLSKYCKDNNINISTIRARIWKKKQSKKYKNYTEQEIVDMVIEAYGSAIKYMYKGIALRQYCLDNNIKSNEIIFPITERAVQKHLKLVCDYLGDNYKDISTHSFRKFFATNIYINNDYDVILVQKLLQHSSPTTTQKYIGIENKKLEKAIQDNLNLI